MELIAPSIQTSAGVDEISLQKQRQQQDDGKSQTGPKSANNKRALVWPEFKVPLPDPVLGKFSSAFSFSFHNSLKDLQERFSVGKEPSAQSKLLWSLSQPLLPSMKLRSSPCVHWNGIFSR